MSKVSDVFFNLPISRLSWNPADGNTRHRYLNNASLSSSRLLSYHIPNSCRHAYMGVDEFRKELNLKRNTYVLAPKGPADHNYEIVLLSWPQFDWKMCRSFWSFFRLHFRSSRVSDCACTTSVLHCTRTNLVPSVRDQDLKHRLLFFYLHSEIFKF